MVHEVLVEGVGLHRRAIDWYEGVGMAGMALAVIYREAQIARTAIDMPKIRPRAL